MRSVWAAAVGVLFGASGASAWIQVPERAPESAAHGEARIEEAALSYSTASEDDLLLREAEQLGVVREIDRSHTGLSGRHHQLRLARAIVREARQSGLDPLLVAAVIRIESNYDSFAVSPAGALGLMQLMPETGLWLAKRSKEPLRGARYLFDYERNVALGCAYLASLIEDFGDVRYGLLAYNVGPNAAKKLLLDRAARREWLNGYPRKVLLEYGRLGSKAPHVAWDAADELAVVPLVRSSAYAMASAPRSPLD